MATQQFPEWEFTSETWLLTCFFHDIGTVDKHTHGTLMSFEAIIRHQDSAEIGTITTLGLLVQIATQYGKLHPFRRPAAYRRNIN
jgi:cyanamide hydratase